MSNISRIRRVVFRPHPLRLRRLLSFLAGGTGIRTPASGTSVLLSTTTPSSLVTLGVPFHPYKLGLTFTCLSLSLQKDISISFLSHLFLMLVVLPRCVKGPAGPRSRLGSRAAACSCLHSDPSHLHDNRQTIRSLLYLLTLLVVQS